MAEMAAARSDLFQAANGALREASDGSLSGDGHECGIKRSYTFVTEFQLPADHCHSASKHWRTIRSRNVARVGPPNGNSHCRASRSPVAADRTVHGMRVDVEWDRRSRKATRLSGLPVAAAIDGMTPSVVGRRSADWPAIMLPCLRHRHVGFPSQERMLTMTLNFNHNNARHRPAEDVDSPREHARHPCLLGW